MPKLGATKNLKIKEETYSQLLRKADKVFSDYIRERDNWTCFTCGKQGSKSEIQNGHYIERNKKGTRYDERNCNAQCSTCNMWKKGNLRVYAQRLVSKYGGGILDALQSLADASKGKKFPRIDLIEIISLYSEKLNQLRRKNNLEIIHVEVREEVDAE